VNTGGGPFQPVEIVEEDRDVGGLFVRRVAPIDISPIRTPLLMVHGAYDGWWVWQRWLWFFANAGWTCYAMSLRNHPGSYAMPEPDFLRVGIGDYVDDVVTVAGAIDAPPVLIGHSMGGMAVQKAAEILEPRGLVLVASVGPGQLGRHADDFPLNRPADCRAEFLREAGETPLDPDTFRRVHELLVPESPKALNDIRGRTPVNRSRIRCPVLVVGAENEQFKVHRAEAIARFYGSEYLVVPRARHALMYEGEWMMAAIQVAEWLHRVVSGEGLPPIVQARSDGRAPTS
jgi:pimeloyl-ACP methyl ester carboxylesterase